MIFLPRVADSCRHNPHLSGNSIEATSSRGSIPHMSSGTLVELKHRILTTREMARAVGLRDTEWISAKCRKGEIRGAFRLGDKGAWRIHSKDFREWLESEDISTRALDEYLESHT